MGCGSYVPKEANWISKLEAIDNLDGTIFVMRNLKGHTNGVGCASFHFNGGSTHTLDNGNSYIDYTRFPKLRLASGAKPPAQKSFTEVSYDPTTRTFTGKIDWEGDSLDASGAPGNRLLSGSTQVYTIVFQEGFFRVQSGEVTSLDATGKKLQTQNFEKDPAIDDPAIKRSGSANKEYHAIHVDYIRTTEAIEQTRRKNKKRQQAAAGQEKEEREQREAQGAV